MQPIVAYIPIFTTVFAIYFIVEITRHYKKRNTSYLLWWSIGVFAFGLGTFAESIHALFGWNEVNVRLCPDSPRARRRATAGWARSRTDPFWRRGRWPGRPRKGKPKPPKLK